MKRILPALLPLPFLACLCALFMGLMWQNTLLLDELASAFRLTEKVIHANRLFDILLCLMMCLSLLLFVWNELLKSRLRKLEHQTEDRGA